MAKGSGECQGSCKENIPLVVVVLFIQLRKSWSIHPSACWSDLPRPCHTAEHQGPMFLPQGRVRPSCCMHQGSRHWGCFIFFKRECWNKESSFWKQSVVSQPHGTAADVILGLDQVWRAEDLFELTRPYTDCKVGCWHQSELSVFHRGVCYSRVSIMCQYSFVPNLSSAANIVK